jgi:TPP-dependent pyruvate/acetoin dehydrogenase alpha subunit
VCFLGDGTTNIGNFHESLNIAAVWKLPVVYVCENNLYMEYTPIAKVTAVRNPAADRASAYGLEPLIVDGNDPEEVYELARKRLARARSGEGPSLIEAKTYRKGGHSRADPAKYRPEDEVKEWLARDPVDNYRKRLLELGIDERALVEIESETMAKVDEAEAEARAGPLPDPSSIETNVWSDGGSAWRR